MAEEESASTPTSQAMERNLMEKSQKQIVTVKGKKLVAKRDSVNFSSQVETRIYDKHSSPNQSNLDSKADTHPRVESTLTAETTQGADTSSPLKVDVDFVLASQVGTSKKTRPPGPGRIGRSQTLRMEFLRVTTEGEAFRKWSQVMAFIREIDPSLIIQHVQDPTKNVIAQSPIPQAQGVGNYALMASVSHRSNNQAKFACVTTIETNRTITEHKRGNPQFIPTLMKFNVFLHQTKLQTANTVEVGFFVGLHPSLTNLTWRTEQIHTILNEQGQKIQIQLYPRKLNEGPISTSVIVVRCPKNVASVVVTQLTTLPPGSLGKQVEFVPYSLIRRTSQKSFRSIFSLQNKFIAEVGAIFIQGIPEETMRFQYGKTKQPFHQWLLESKYVISVEQSDTPERNKWWVLTHKDHITHLNKHLTTTVKEIMVKIHPTPEDYEVQSGEGDRRDAEPENLQLTSLLERLTKRIPTEEIAQPNPTGRARYADIARKHNSTLDRQHPEPPMPTMTQVTESTVNSSLTSPSPPTITQLQQLDEKHQKHTKQLMESQKDQFAAVLAKQEEQTAKMIEQFQATMKDMMSTMFSQMMEMVTTILKNTHQPHLDRPTGRRDQAEIMPPQYPTTQYDNPIVENPGQPQGAQTRHHNQRPSHPRRPGGRGGGCGAEVGGLQNQPRGILRQTQAIREQDTNYKDETYWENTAEREYAGETRTYFREGPINTIQAQSGGYQSTVASMG